MRKPIWLSRGWLLCLLMASVRCAGEKNSNELVFKLKEVSVFAISPREARYSVRAQLYAGQEAVLVEEPPAAIRVWPVFMSEKPIYGWVRFAREYGNPDSGMQYHFAIDKSTATDAGYNRLYFDLNRDLDVTNDKPLAPQESPPARALLRHRWIKQQVCFDCLQVDFDFGSPGKHPLEIMPRLIIGDNKYLGMRFVTTKVRRGEIEIARHKYDAILGHGAFITGRFDRPFTLLHLVPKEESVPELGWPGAHYLATIRRIGDKYYRFSATPNGDCLFVRTYAGDFGRFELEPGGREVERMQMSGALVSKDAIVAVGGEIRPGGKPARTPGCRLPVGKYLPHYLSIDYGRLHVFITDNCYSDGNPSRAWGWDRPRVHWLEIRKEQPYVLDFPHEPEVLFASPAKDQRVKVGEKLEVKAVLVDPKLDIMIGDLVDCSQEPPLELDPTVLITRLDGRKVAEGVMPFGPEGTCEYTWSVPKDIELKGKEEVFELHVMYDTLDLYGKVSGERRLVVYRE